MVQITTRQQSVVGRIKMVTLKENGRYQFLPEVFVCKVATYLLQLAYEEFRVFYGGCTTNHPSPVTFFIDI